MALSEDASAPAPLTSVVGGPGPTGVTTANFNPPANALILVAITSDGLNTSSTATATVTDNLGSTFTVQVQVSVDLSGYSGIFTKYLVSPQTGYNVTIVLNSAQMQTSNSAGYLIQTFVITGASAIQNGANVGTSGTNAMSAAIVAKNLGSYIYGSANDWSTNAALTPTANTTAKTSLIGSGDSWGTFRSTSPTASLTSQTYGYTTSNQHTIALYEVVPGITPAPIAWLTA
jgi:hypothetical protein